MRVRFLFSLGVLAIIAAACNSEDARPALLSDFGSDPVNAATGDDGIPVSSVTASTTYMVEVGGGVPVAPGQQVGYALTAIAPLSYQFRWTGDAAVANNCYQNFYGSVWTSGKFTNVTPGCLNAACPLEAGDTVSAPVNLALGERVDWNTNASTGWDGFSFTVDTEPVYFDVFIDSQRHPELFFFASAPVGATSEPSQSPFAIISEPLGDAATDGATDAATDSATASDTGAD